MSPAHAPRIVTDDNLSAVIDALTAADVVALDTEFHTEGHYTPELFLVQLHVPDVGTWIVDPLVSDHLARLGPALLSGCSWLVHAGFQDLRLMARVIGGVAETVLDTQIAAAFVSPVYPDALSRLVARWLDEPLPKASQLSDWSKRPLSEAQLVYAARDVLCLPLLWAKIMEAVDARGRREATLAACAWAREDAFRDGTDEAWRRLVRNTSLKGRPAAVLRELATWRETYARDRNRPAPFILGDPMLRQLAKSQPTSVGELHGNRRLNARTIERHGSAILQAVKRGLAVPESDFPFTAPRGSAEAERVLWIQLAVAAWGRAHEVGPRLILPDAHAETLASLSDPSRDSVAKLLGPWRDDLVGDMLFAALQGAISLRLTAHDVRVDPI